MNRKLCLVLTLASALGACASQQHETADAGDSIVVTGSVALRSSAPPASPRRGSA